MICTVSPAAINYYQTLSTLRFASRAKIIKNKALLNEIIDDKSALEFYKNEVRRLQKELQNLKMNSSSQSERGENSKKEVLEQIMKTNESLSHELESLKQKYLNERDKNEAMKRNTNNNTYNPNNNVVFSSNVNNQSNQPGQNNPSNNLHSNTNLGFNPSNNVNINSSAYNDLMSRESGTSVESNTYKSNNNNLVYIRQGFNPSSTNSLQFDYSNIDRSNQLNYYPGQISNNPNKQQTQQFEKDKKAYNEDIGSKYTRDFSKELNYNYGAYVQNPILNTNSAVNTSQNNSNVYNTGDDRFLKEYKPNQSKLQYDYQKIGESFYIDSMLSKISSTSNNLLDSKHKNWKNESERIALDYK